MPSAWGPLLLGQLGTVLGVAEVVAGGSCPGNAICCAGWQSCAACSQLHDGPTAASYGAPLRVFYTFDPKRNAILLIGGNKTGQQKRFYKKMITKADSLYDEQLNTLQSPLE